MTDANSQTTSQTHTESYWTESRRPWPSLVFIAPFLVLYELGVAVWGVQNGADLWMRNWLNQLGFSQHLLLPALTAGILLGWRFLRHDPWKFPTRILSTMGVECLLAAIGLRAILFLQSMVPAAVAAQITTGRTLPQAIGYLGAGIYEELLFRLVLLSVVTWLLGHWLKKPRAVQALAIVATSLLFAAAHHIGPAGEQWRLFYFTFRFIAGAYFAVLFTYRGFGIAAGTHALYDILVAIF